MECYLESFGSVDGSQRSEHPEDSEDLHHRDGTGAADAHREAASHDSSWAQVTHDAQLASTRTH